VRWVRIAADRFDRKTPGSAGGVWSDRMGARILVVDDEPFLRKILTVMLTRAGHQVECAEDGDCAWARLVGSAPPDLVISDLMMPGMSGLDLLRRLRHEHGATVPFLLLTARGHPLDEAEALQGGADIFMTKPFSQKELLEQVSGLLARGSSGGG
jgi:two-component system, OmpR family, phosphate regulon response regulator PhoB